MDGQVSKDLAIERYVGFLETTHESRVADAELGDGSVDAGDPEAAQVAL